MRTMLHHLEFSPVLEDPQYCFPLMAASGAQSFILSGSSMTLIDISCLLHTWDFVPLDVVLFCFSVLGIEPRTSQIPGKYFATTALYSQAFFTFTGEVHDFPRWP